MTEKDNLTAMDCKKCMRTLLPSILSFPSRIRKKMTERMVFKFSYVFFFFFFFFFFFQLRSG